MIFILAAGGVIELALRPLVLLLGPLRLEAACAEGALGIAEHLEKEGEIMAFNRNIKGK